MERESSLPHRQRGEQSQSQSDSPRSKVPAGHPLGANTARSSSSFSSFSSATSCRSGGKGGAASQPARTIPEFSLASHVILVTGGARGLGLSQAEGLLESGATVYALDILPEPSTAFKQIQEKARSQFGTALHYSQIDVKDAAALNKIVEGIANNEGRLDGLIAAAGIQQETAALDFSAEDANKIFAVNLTGVMMTAQAVAKQMIRLVSSSRQRKKASGSIVLIASMSGSVANRGLPCSAYNTSKAGVIQMARSLAAEWGSYGIRVNSISPGYIMTEMVVKLLDKFPQRKKQWADENMLGRLSKPEEYRGAAVFLLSEASSFVTGADLKIDGGHTAW